METPSDADNLQTGVLVVAAATRSVFPNTLVCEMKVLGYAGRKFAGHRRLLDNHTPGMPYKHEAWPGVFVPAGFHAEFRSDRGQVTGTIKHDMKA